LNRDLRPVLHHARVSSPNAIASNLAISRISYALETYCQFNIPNDTVFSCNEQALPIADGDIEEIMNFV
jgi:hypothetical protein